MRRCVCVGSGGGSVCVCVCVCERERERESATSSECVIHQFALSKAAASKIKKTVLSSLIFCFLFNSSFERFYLLSCPILKWLDSPMTRVSSSPFCPGEGYSFYRLNSKRIQNNQDHLTKHMKRRSS